jgi:RNA polymerase sigma-70 factor, ECF subfamily
LEQDIQAFSEFPLSNNAASALIGKIKDGDSSSLMALYEETNKLLYGLIAKILGEKIAAEETLLDSYTQIWRHAASYDPGTSVLEWLAKIARSNAIARLLWNKKAKGEYESILTRFDFTGIFSNQQQDIDHSPLGTLEPYQREILELAYFSGMNCEEIASSTGKPLGEIRTQARIGLSAISESLKPSANDKTE